jgi:Tfp pilus assembly protein PilF
MDRKTNHLTIISCLFLAIGTLAVYSPVRTHPFVNYDDQNYVTENAHVQAGLTWETFTWALTSTEADNWHPLTWLSHALDCQLYGLNPAGHHITNVLLHVLNVLLLFLLLTRVTGALGRSLMVAALFAVHPLNVESVAWVAERKNVLSTLFFLLALGAYGWYAVKPNVKRYLAMAALFALGLAAKPMVITLPFVLLLLDFWPLKRIEGWSAPSAPGLKERKTRKTRPGSASSDLTFPVATAPFSRLVLEKLPLLMLCAGSAVITIIAQNSYGAVRSLERFSLGLRLENAVISYAMYVWKAFWPTQLAVFYPYSRQPAAWQLGLSVLFLIAVSTLAWKERSVRGYLLAGWLWFLGTLVPVIGIVQVGDQAMADRYAYVPLIGIFVMVVWGGAEWAERLHFGVRPRTALAATILAILSFLAWRQVGYWRSYYDMWAHAAQVTKGNLAAEEGLSKAMLLEGRAEEALPGLEKAVRFNPRDPTRHANLGAALFQCGRLEDSVKEYVIAAEVASDTKVQSRSYESLATLYYGLGDYAKVRESYRQALKADPQGGPGMVLRLSESDEPTGDTYMQLGLLFEEMGQVSQARSAYEQALKLDPTLVLAKQSLDALTAPINRKK